MKISAAVAALCVGIALTACVTHPQQPRVPPAPGAEPAAAANPQDNSPIAGVTDPGTCFRYDAGGKPHPTPCP